MSAHLPFELDDGVDGAALLGRVAPILGGAVASVRPTDLNLPTSCANWTLRDLLNHVIGGAAMFAAAFDGAPVQDISGRLPDVVGDDPMGAFQRGLGGFGAALEQPGVMERVIELPFGAMTVNTFLRFVAFDLLIHAWDISAATGTTIDVPDDLVAEIEPFARLVVDGLPRDPSFLAPAIDPRSAAAPLERLVAYTGRAVG